MNAMRDVVPNIEDGETGDDAEITDGSGHCMSNSLPQVSIENHILHFCIEPQGF